MFEPYQNVTGTDRDDDLLSLEESARPHRDALLALADLLERTTLVGRPAPIVETIGHRIRNPRVGDLVAERSGLVSLRADRRIHSLGILVEHRHEWETTGEEWRAVQAEDPFADRTAVEVWYVQYGPAAGDVCRWENCRFIALPGLDYRPR
jgi:hypothetical protein